MGLCPLTLPEVEGIIFKVVSNMNEIDLITWEEWMDVENIFQAMRED